MREHAIPQDVVGYKFHIVGNMTLKQFLEVGAGCIVGFLIFSTNLYDIIKWPLITLAVGAGVLAAFVPFEERPLDHWFVTFFKILYKPTKFFWRKEPKVPEPFLFTANQETNTRVEVDLSPYRRQRAKEFLVSVEPQRELDAFEVAELNRMSSILSTFETITVAEVQAVKQPSIATLKLTQHSLRQVDDGNTQTATTTDVYVEAHTPVMPEPTQLQVSNLELTPKQMAAPILNPNQVAQNIDVPELQTVSVAKSHEIEEQEVTTTPVEFSNQAVYSTAAAEPVALTATHQAAYNTALPFPSPPTEPNKIVGMVLTPDNLIVPEAIIEIKTTTGSTARAVKTNALGQFFISTPLPNGEYIIEMEKEGLNASPLSLSLTGQVVPPLEIRTTA